MRPSPARGGPLFVLVISQRMLSILGGSRVLEIDGSQDLKRLIRGELRDELPNSVIFDTVFR